ncbi:MAG: hypothetical protein AAFX59_07825, partial [Pseudomonadota bacterium]
LLAPSIPAARKAGNHFPIFSTDIETVTLLLQSLEDIQLLGARTLSQLSCSFETPNIASVDLFSGEPETEVYIESSVEECAFVILIPSLSVMTEVFIEQ